MICRVLAIYTLDFELVYVCLIWPIFNFFVIACITEINLPNNNDNQLLQLCTARTAWSDSDQAVQAVHSCKAGNWVLFGPIRY